LSSDNTRPSITLPVSFPVLFYQSFSLRMFQFQNFQLKPSA